MKVGPCRNLFPLSWFILLYWIYFPIGSLCRRHYSIPSLCIHLKKCPCKYIAANSVILVPNCPVFPQEDSAKFTSTVPLNAILVYEDKHITAIRSGSFDRVIIGRLELLNMQNVSTVDDDVFHGAKIDSIKIDFGRGAASRVIRVKPNFFRGWTEGLRSKAKCVFGSSIVKPWYDQFSKNCRSVELLKSDPPGYQTILPSEMIPELKTIRRLVINGGFTLKAYGGNPFSSIDDTLQHLELGGSVLTNLTSHSFGSLIYLQSIKLSHNHQNLTIDGSAVKKWLSRKPNLQKIALEEGFQVKEDILHRLENPKIITELSLKDANITQMPSNLHKFISLVRLDLRGIKLEIPFLQQLLEPLTNLSALILDWKEIDKNLIHCNCTDYDWIYAWPPYKEQGIKIFHVTTNPGSKNVENDRLIHCALKCSAEAHYQKILMIACAIAALHLYRQIIIAY